MNIIVCVKNVPFTQEVDLVLDASKQDVKKDNLVYVINEWDNYAIEEAIRIKEETGGHVTAVTLGKEADEEVLRRCLAMGADEAIRVERGDLNPDASMIAAILSAVVKTIPHDIILTGVQSDDLNNGITGSLIAERLGLVHAAVVNSLKISEGKAQISIELEGGQDEMSQVTLPALFAIQTGINEPRYVSIMGIRKASKKEIKVIDASGLGLPGEDLQPSLIMEEMFMPPETEGAEMLQGDAGSLADQIIRIIREKGVSL
ncbi:MAG: electron transfer flavoprotein subunit beta/FixA family protein [Deltaproteobacteria bacterium]|nr:electron transfer flavoprotein subunit beta/FixA family protein [Deltaproteobacteria bacterium]